MGIFFLPLMTALLLLASCAAGHGGKVFHIVRVITADGDQEVMLKSVKWAVPRGSYL